MAAHTSTADPTAAAFPMPEIRNSTLDLRLGVKGRFARAHRREKDESH
jgi:hypothetical protein